MKALAIAGLTTDDDVRWLAKQAATHRTIIEIGPFQGRSTRALADATSGQVYAIDDWNLSHTGRSDLVARATFYRNCRDLIETQKVLVIEQRSQDGLPDLLRGIVADMLWIDGDHTETAVRADIAIYGPLVRKGGLICGHDYSTWHPGVVKAVDAVFGPRRVNRISIHRSIWWVTA